jgi:DNA-binding transcriptional ArsR family regulator
MRLPIFRSKEQARLLSELFLYAIEPLSLSQLAERTGISPSGVHKEVARLESAGLVVSRRVGRSRLVSANQDSPFHGDLRSLLTKAFGPAMLLAEGLSTIDGVEEAFIYGSWAASEESNLGRPARDVDLMVLGSPDLDRLYEITGEVEELIGRPVNVAVFTRKEWEADESGFADAVKKGAQIELIGSSPIE